MLHCTHRHLSWYLTDLFVITESANSLVTVELPLSSREFTHLTLPTNFSRNFLQAMVLSEEVISRRLRAVDQSSESIQTTSMWILHHRDSVSQFVTCWMDVFRTGLLVFGFTARSDSLFD